MINKERFISDLLSLVPRNVPWLHQGRDPSVGLDCIGLPRWAYMQQLGPLPEELERGFDAYLRRPDGKRLLRIMREWFDEVTEKQIADLVVIYDRTNPQHIAIMTTETDAVEAYKGLHVGKVLCQRLDTRRRIAAIFRFPTEGKKLDKWRK